MKSLCDKNHFGISIYTGFPSRLRYAWGRKRKKKVICRQIIQIKNRNNVVLYGSITFYVFSWSASIITLQMTTAQINSYRITFLFKLELIPFSFQKIKKRYHAEIYIARITVLILAVIVTVGFWSLQQDNYQDMSHLFASKKRKVPKWKKLRGKEKKKKKKDCGALHWQWYTISLLREVTVGIHTLNYTLHEYTDLLW